MIASGPSHEIVVSLTDLGKLRDRVSRWRVRTTSEPALQRGASPFSSIEVNQIVSGPSESEHDRMSSRNPQISTSPESEEETKKRVDFTAFYNIDTPNTNVTTLAGHQCSKHHLSWPHFIPKDVHDVNDKLLVVGANRRA